MKIFKFFFSGPSNSTKEASARPIRRLWSFLVRQEKVQDIFIRLVFGKKHAAVHSSGNANADSVSVYSDAAGQGILLVHFFII